MPAKPNIPQSAILSIRDGLLHGDPPKAVAADHGVDISTVYKIRNHCGLQSLFLTAKERELIERYRANPESAASLFLPSQRLPT